ncbi:MAG TPA: DNA polymerase III subunit alpha [Castellaniella sp.]|uniref:DNA polymerase III subunit alpha n=1 Tax=Castellaniella sp. TaxID=1955812 RepID=UPI002EEABA1B
MTESSENPLFVHLRCHTEFSVVDGIARIPALVKQAQAFGQPAMAITDLANLFGWIKFYRAARKVGIKAIAGCDVWLENPADEDKPFRLLLLATGHDSYLELCELLTRAWIENVRLDKALVRREWLSGRRGLIVLSGGRAGDVGCALEAGRADEAQRLARQWAADFPGSYFIELQRAGFDGDEAYVQAALRLAAGSSLPVVATHPIQFLAPSDFRAHEARVCIAEGELLGNPRRVRRFTADQYMPDSVEMARRFADVPSAIANSVQIALRCNLTLSLGHPQLPLFPTPEGVSLDDYMVKLANEGFQRRMVQLYPDAQERARQMPKYQERLDRECSVIVGMGFPGYFLIVQDFINWGKSHGVPVGPGRGSGAGSLVAFSLGITDLDPLRYDLLFERFLNPERVSMPDFDVDFCQDNRERVIEYVKEKYGRDAVSQIATFGTLGAKAVVRDVGRVLEMPYSVCDNLSKMIPFNPVDPWSLDRTLENEPAFKERYDTDEEIHALIDLARPLEGLTRNIGMHAGGVIIAPGKLTDFCPLYCQPGSETSVVSQFDKGDVEDAGLVKFDFLGLRNLTILDWAVRYVREFNPDKRDFDLMSLPLDDAATYELLCSANTTAVFQLEGRGMKELLKSMQPNVFEDLIALLALFRPGPLESGMVVDFVNRKHGRAKVDYFHPDLEPVLKSTYGVIVYQEQVMLISQIIGGYSLGGADLLRRAMGKKKPEYMAKQRSIFQEGAVKKGYDADLAAHLFDLMEKFAGYGFNKSHSAAYALISYQTAWLKVYHPAEFLAATMLSDMDDTDKIQVFWRDALDNKVAVLPPDVNASGYRFAPVADEYTAQGKPPRTIRYGLGGVKGTGHAAVDAIVAAREEGGAFASLFDFCARVDRHTVNRRTIEALIRAGAFDSLEPNRAALLETLGSAIEAAEQVARDANQSSLFDDNAGEVVAGELARVLPWDLETRLTQEKTALGFYFSGHLFDAWRDEVRRVAPTPLARLAPSKGNQWIAGVLAAVRPRMTKRGKMLYALLDDGTAQIEVAIFNELYEQYRAILKEDRPLVIQGRVSHDDYSGGLRISADDLYDLQRIRETRARSLRLTLPSAPDIQSLQSLLAPWRAPEHSIPVELRVSENQFSCLLRLGDEWRVRMDESLIANARSWLARENVEIFYG